MAGERRINWGADATGARYRTEDTGDGANFVVAEDLDGGTVLLEYDSTASEWVSRGPVNMSGNDVTNVGALDAASVSTISLGIDGHGDIEAIETGTVSQSGLDTSGQDGTWSTSSNTQTTETFDTAFDNPPEIILTPNNDAGSGAVNSGGLHLANAISSTDFTYQYFQYVADNFTGATAAVDYIAIEQS